MAWIAALLLLAGCQTAPPDYGTLADKVNNGEAVAVDRLREAFLATPDLSERLDRLQELERQALVLVADEPLKLGSLGTAILDLYYGSLTGHYVLARFYEHVDTPAAAEPHEAWIARIRDTMTRSRDGSREQPLPVMTAVEAETYLLLDELEPVGSVYQTSTEYPFTLLLQGQPSEGALVSRYFDLGALYRAAAADFTGPEGLPEFSPYTLIGFLAKSDDTSAQAAIGGVLAAEGQLDNAEGWLRASSRKGNVVANSLLARIYWQRASEADSDAEREAALGEVMDNYLHAVALGSADAMYFLGVLYLNGHYGEDNVSSGLPLLEQAASLDHPDAAMFLAHLYYTGEQVERDLSVARDYYAQSAALGNPFARRSYARFLLDRDAGQDGDPRAADWLEELAADDDAEAMILLGNLHARGVAVPQDPRRAVRWFKRAVAAAPEDASVINEVAWTLTVSDVEGLRRERYALDIMEGLMSRDEEARQRPEYLDTLAAAWAANGDFERAVALQQQALDRAVAQQQEEVLDVLRAHLEAFRAGETLTEAAP